MTSIDPTDGSAARRHLWVLLLLIGAFFVLRSPVMFRQLPGADEDFFAVPGWTILNDGVPRIPYLPARNGDSAFYKADEILFALPPLYFYVQALFYSVLGTATGVARLASATACAGGVCVLYCLARRLTNSPRAAIWAAGLYLFSRAVYFPSVNGRPDSLCSLMGLLCLLQVCRYRDSQHLRDAVLAGLFGGMGMLTHPFAAVFCLQAGVWLIAGSRSWKRRVTAAGTFVLVALSAYALWLPLILLEPEIFWVQFSNNVLDRAGPGLVSRLLLPVESFTVQFRLYVEHLGPLQASLLAGASLYVGLRAIRQRPSRYGTIAWLALSALYLHVASQGTHPAKGYWVYTAGLQFVCLGLVVCEAQQFLQQSLSPRALKVVASLGVLALCGMFVPGSGVRTAIAHVRHWKDPNYNADVFTQQLMARFSKEQKLIVDPGYVYEFHKAGYDVLLALNFRFFFDVSGRDYDYMIGGPYSITGGVPEDLGAVPMERVGNFEDVFGCRAVLYRHPSHPELVRAE